ncbi:hypothetical protein ERJ75_001027500 [Trypanosoma vivax]|uniref:Uncharacterized protein n=1 Tax=Trypanosoma vivax (strain Y486) TaxID=1055687 RepID=G0TR51_TRYVY|nr:hypothetical protein TRVL_09612 [Trypanosoma vivax]KAH8611695.1 hypothetical protein ERJ75_001027500 [Trypanosoma vivax]CCC46415.1 conserved hypothetical protein [Trypanosoma vivax Y486]
MGGIPSREAPTNLFCLRYGTHEVGLIPLVYRYLHSDNRELREQFIRVRNDPSVRYGFMRDPEYGMDVIPPANYSEKHLDRFLDAVDETLYDSTPAMLADEDSPIWPVPCAVCFVYVNGREGSDCFSFYGRRINIIGHFGCYETEEQPTKEPFLYVRKSILKAAGDRTLERVVTLAAMMFKTEFFRAVQTVCPTRNPLEMFQRRLRPMTLVASTPWNSYPTLKFLYDTAVLAWAYGKEIVSRDPPTLSMYAVESSGEGGLAMRVSGSVLLWAIMRVSETLTFSAVRGSWEQFVLDDFEMQQKEKIVSNWLTTSPHVKDFLGSKEFTSYVQDKLAMLLREVVRARETPTDDATAWGTEQECSHDGKIYRIFNSESCGPFLATVKKKTVKRSSASNCENVGSRASGTDADPPVTGDEGKKKNSVPGVARGNNTNSSIIFLPHNGSRPPQYKDAVNSVLQSQLANTRPQNICQLGMAPTSTIMHDTNLSVHPNSVPFMIMPVRAQAKQVPPQQVSPAPVSSTFLPLFQPTAQNHQPISVQPFGVPYVLLAAPGQAEQQPNGGLTGCGAPQAVNIPAFHTTQQGCLVNAGGSMESNPTTQEIRLQGGVSNYVLLPDGRIGVVNAPTVPSVGFWNQ